MTTSASGPRPHVAIILDGNRRWARGRGLPPLHGHVVGERVLLTIIESAIDLGVEWLTVFTFSVDNWKRSTEEVAHLIGLNEILIRERADFLMSRGVRVRYLGDIWDSRVPQSMRDAISEIESVTIDNRVLTLTVAFNYGGREEIVMAARKSASMGTPEPLMTTARLSELMQWPDAPPVDLVIRTSGEKRLSNFILWGAAYAELYFTDTMWPDFTPEHLVDAVHDYEGRQRRRGT